MLHEDGNVRPVAMAQHCRRAERRSNGKRLRKWRPFQSTAGLPAEKTVVGARENREQGVSTALAGLPAEKSVVGALSFPMDWKPPLRATVAFGGRSFVGLAICCLVRFPGRNS